VNSLAYDQLFQEEVYHFSAPVAVVLSKSWDAYTSDEQLLLRKILSSVKVDLNAVQLLSRASLRLESLKIFSPARVLVFGSEIENDDVPLYQSTPAQGFRVIRADDLTALDDQRKKSLWNALRLMFG
jgi:hypothetical protein